MSMKLLARPALFYHKFQSDRPPSFAKLDRRVLRYDSPVQPLGDGKPLDLDPRQARRRCRVRDRAARRAYRFLSGIACNESFPLWSKWEFQLAGPSPLKIYQGPWKVVENAETEFFFSETWLTSQLEPISRTHRASLARLASSLHWPRVAFVRRWEDCGGDSSQCRGRDPEMLFGYRFERANRDSRTSQIGAVRE